MKATHQSAVTAAFLCVVATCWKIPTYDGFKTCLKVCWHRMDALCCGAASCGTLHRFCRMPQDAETHRIATHPAWAIRNATVNKKVLTWSRVDNSVNILVNHGNGSNRFKHFCLADTYHARRVHIGKRNVTVWRPSVGLSIPSAYSPWLTREQHATRPAYISAQR